MRNHSIYAPLLIFIAAAFALNATAQSDPLTVTTKLGQAHGKLINQNQVKAFLGLPFAAPPVGDLRWKAPAPAAKWAGLRDATQFGSHCAQNLIFPDIRFQDTTGPSEDCLYLNVYSPAKPTAAKLPVMLWIHGGGYTSGSGDEPRHNGDYLPLKGVVLVTINYRLGPFGFLAADSLAKEQGGTAGNYGLMDMIAALHWVHENIAAFNGDPGNVTIFGESAGSFAVSTLVASPEARGLIHRAIGESGGAFSDTLAVSTLAEQGKKDQEWIDALGVKSLAELRALPTDKILAASKSRMAGFNVVVDGNVLKETVAATYHAGRQAHIPLLAGFNRDEGSFAAMGMDAEKFKQRADKLFKANAAEFLKLYPATDDATAQRSAADFGGDLFIAFSTWKWIDAHEKTGQTPVYRYKFELPSPTSKYVQASAAFHSDEIEYVFETLDTREGAAWRPEDRKLSDQISTYWTNFAKTGNPNGAGLPTWPRYGKGVDVLHLNSEITATEETDRPRYEFFERVGMPSMADLFK